MGKKSRITKQKELMQIELKKINSFFTANEFLIKLKKKNKKIGIATIYRFLNDLRKKRELHSYICERRNVYSRNDNNHCRFICQKCHKITHFNIENIEMIRKKVEGSICHFQIDVHGICNECLKFKGKHKKKRLKN